MKKKEEEFQKQKRHLENKYEKDMGEKEAELQRTKNELSSASDQIKRL